MLPPPTFSPLQATRKVKFLSLLASLVKWDFSGFFYIDRSFLEDSRFSEW